MRKDQSRREFLALSLLMGLAPLIPTRLLAATVLQEEGPYTGPLMDRIQDLLAPYHRFEITQEQLLAGIKERYADLDPQHELASYFRAGVSDIQSLRTLKLKVGVRRTKMEIQLFLIPPGHSHAPHGHDNLVSYQILLQGQLRLREFERRQDVPGAMIITPLESRIARPGDTFETTQHHHNIHWFGAEESSMILNINVVTHDRIMSMPGLLQADSASRIYIDPTGSVKNGEIFAPLVNGRDAEIFFGERLPFENSPIKK